MIACTLKEETCLIQMPRGLTETVEAGSKFIVIKKLQSFTLIKGDAGSFIVSKECFNRCFDWDIKEKP